RTCGFPRCRSRSRSRCTWCARMDRRAGRRPTGRASGTSRRGSGHSDRDEVHDAGSRVDGGLPQRRLARIAGGRYVPRMSFALSRKDREAFLAGTHVAVVSVTEAGRGPLTVPVWYRYQPGGEVRIITSGATRKIGLLRAAGRMSLCVQEEAPPFRYVSVEGPVTIQKSESDA